MPKSPILATSTGQSINRWDELLALRDRAVHIVGAGSVEGAHLLLFMLEHGFTNLTGHDFTTAEEFPRSFARVHVGWPKADRARMCARIQAEVDVHYRDRYLDGIDAASAIAVTTGWYLYRSNQRLLESTELQARFFSLTQLYLALAPGLVIGVSGSQGKSTTTGLLGEILQAAGRDVIRGGNDRHGQQALGRLEQASPRSLLLLEISNRQLKMLNRSPNISVLTNIYPNHLDEHPGGWDGYLEAKSRMVKHQHRGDIAVLNADLDVSRGLAGMTPARVLWFGQSLEAASDGGATTGVRVEADRLVSTGLPDFDLDRAEVAMPGRHNAFNVAAAATAALALDVPAEVIAGVARRFRGLKHRLQMVWNVAGVRYYDDLNSTTPAATQAALETLDPGVVWILGGDDKGLDSSILAKFAAGTVRLALALPGPGTDAIVDNLESAGVEVTRVGGFRDAVARAVAAARPGESVLLSPACPGFFSRYYVGADEDTGFRKLVREIAPPRAATSPPARKPRT